MESKNKTLAPGGLLSTPTINHAIVEVEFGSPLKNCLHYGICRVTIPSNTLRQPCTCWCEATVYSLDKNLLQFVFERNKMQEKTFDKYFKSGFFRVEDEYELPKKILLKVGLEKFAIKKGKYPIFINDEKIIIYL